MSEKFLKVEDLVVEYRTGGKVVHAVNNVSFELERGKTLGLVGETGAGKTTIAKTILRVLPDAQAKVKSGKVILDGEDLLSLSEAAMRKVRGGQVTMVFQDPMTALNPIMKVGEQIAEVIRKQQTREDKTAREMAEDMLAMVGIPRERYGEYPHQFSGGMKQRVVIAMALACNPHLLLADEPTTALDVTIQAQVLDMMDDLKKKYNTAMILITHDLSEAVSTADRILVLTNRPGTIKGELVIRFPNHEMSPLKRRNYPEFSSYFNELWKILGNGNGDDSSTVDGAGSGDTDIINGTESGDENPPATRNGLMTAVNVGGEPDEIS